MSSKFLKGGEYKVGIYGQGSGGSNSSDKYFKVASSSVISNPRFKGSDVMMFDFSFTRRDMQANYYWVAFYKDPQESAYKYFPINLDSPSGVLLTGSANIKDLDTGKYFVKVWAGSENSWGPAQHVESFGYMTVGEKPVLESWSVDGSNLKAPLKDFSVKGKLSSGNFSEKYVLDFDVDGSGGGTRYEVPVNSSGEFSASLSVRSDSLSAGKYRMGLQACYENNRSVCSDRVYRDLVVASSMSASIQSAAFQSIKILKLNFNELKDLTSSDKVFVGLYNADDKYTDYAQLDLDVNNRTATASFSGLPYGKRYDHIKIFTGGNDWHSSNIRLRQGAERAYTWKSQSGNSGISVN